MAPSFKNMTAALGSELAQRLVPSGFQASAHGWVRRSRGRIDLIEFQKHSSRAEFCVNMGVHFECIFGAGLPRITDCDIVTRLTDRTATWGEWFAGDKWWPIQDGSAGLVRELLERGLPWFDWFALDGPMLNWSAEDILLKKTPLAILMVPRACLLLARILKHMNRPSQAASIARCGIDNAGHAVGPKAALEVILKELNV